MARAPKKLVNWNQLRGLLKKNGFGDYGPDAHKRWLKETPPMPIAEVGGRGKGHQFDYQAVVEWFTGRKIKKAYTPPEVEQDAEYPYPHPPEDVPEQPRNGAPRIGTEDGYDPDSVEDPLGEKLRYQALRERLKFETEIGALIKREEIRPAIDGAFANVRSRLMGVADKVAPIVAHETKAAKCKSVILEAICHALESLSSEGVLEDVRKRDN
jgi:hypothetical protein